MKKATQKLSTGGINVDDIKMDEYIFPSQCLKNNVVLINGTMHQLETETRPNLRSRYKTKQKAFPYLSFKS